MSCIHRGLIALVAAIAPAYAVAADSIELAVHAGKYDRSTITPIVWELPENLRAAKRFSLIGAEDGRPVPVQATGETPPSIVWMLDQPLPAGQTRRYRLSAEAATRSDDAPSETGVTCRDNGRQLVVRVGDQQVLHYNHATVPAPNPAESYYARSGYLHPVFAPDGAAVTDDFAPDHPHQHGIMFAWTNTTFEGRDINFWDQKSQTAKIEHAAVQALRSGPVAGGFQVTLRHSDLTAPNPPRPVLDETWDVRVFNVTDGFLFELTSTQRAAGASPLTVNQYHYGGMAFRGRREWLQPPIAEFLTSDGKSRENGNHSRPHWVTLHGRIDDRPYEVTMLAAPDNFRAPQPVRLHPSKPYFVFAPLVLGEFQIGPDQPLVSRYRFYVRQGPLDAARTKRIWHDFAEPPQVQVVDD